MLLSHWLVLFWSTSASLALDLFEYLSAFSSHCFDSLSWLCVLPSVSFYLHMFCSFSPFSRFGTSSSFLSFSPSFWLEYNFFQLLKEFSVLLITLPGGTRSWSCWWRCIIESISVQIRSILCKENSNLVALLNMSQYVICCPVWRFCTTWSLSCKGPIELNWFVTSDRRVDR